MHPSSTDAAASASEGLELTVIIRNVQLCYACSEHVAATLGHPSWSWPTRPHLWSWWRRLMTKETGRIKKLEAC